MTMGRMTCLLAVLACLATPAAAQAAGPAQTVNELAQQMAKAGPSSGAYVTDLETGEALYAKRPDTPRIPASVEKLYTSSTALLRFGAAGTLTTAVSADAAPDDLGLVTGNLYLRGGGDPTFDAAAAGRLADTLIADTGLTEVQGRVLGDESAFDTLRGPRSLRADYWVGPLSALTFNRGLTGRRFQPSPPLTAAKAFTAALRKRGVAVRRGARVGVAPQGVPQLAIGGSPEIARLIADMNIPSDNFIAETLIKSLGATFGGRGTTAVGARVIRSTVAQLGLRTTVVDGSGLSRSNRTSPRAVVVAADRDVRERRLRAVLLLAADRGPHGTLSGRMRRSAARDACHAKTGTLHDVSALARLLRDARRRPGGVRVPDERRLSGPRQGASRTAWPARSRATTADGLLRAAADAAGDLAADLALRAIGEHLDRRIDVELVAATSSRRELERPQLALDLRVEPALVELEADGGADAARTRRSARRRSRCRSPPSRRSRHRSRRRRRSRARRTSEKPSSSTQTVAPPPTPP